MSAATDLDAVLAVLARRGLTADEIVVGPDTVRVSGVRAPLASIGVAPLDDVADIIASLGGDA